MQHLFVRKLPAGWGWLALLKSSHHKLTAAATFKGQILQRFPSN